MALDAIQKDELQKWSIELDEEEAAIKEKLMQKREDHERALMRNNVLRNVWSREGEGEKRQQAIAQRDGLIKELEAFENNRQERLNEITLVRSELEAFLIRNP